MYDDVVTKRYAHILDEDRLALANEMEEKFYNAVPTKQAQIDRDNKSNIDADEIATMISNNPELLTKILQSIQSANKR